MHYLEIGGAEISLIGLLRSLDYSRYDVDLFLYSHRGELMKFIPREVNLLPEVAEYSMIELLLVEVIKSGYFKIALARLIAKLRMRCYSMFRQPKDGSAIFGFIADSVTPALPSLAHLGQYDLAISFLTPHNIVLDKVSAAKKACWIHTDYSRIDVNVALELPIWSGYDRIVSISDDVTKSFLEVFPTLEEKIVLMENVVSPSFVRQRAEEFDPARELEAGKGTGPVLLSIGRFCYAKNYDNVPEICSHIARRIPGVKWFIIGFGGDEVLIRQKIAEFGMEDHVFILGKKSNPYPYIKACDIYVQPSRYEGKSVTVREAQILSKPVVVTDYPTSRSQVRDGIDGVIVPMDNISCADAIVAFINDKSKRDLIADNLRSTDYDSDTAIDMIDTLIA